MTRPARRALPAGFSLIEVMIATAILLVGLTAVLNMITLAVGVIANQGEAATRATGYCQDKLEQLLALGFSDGATDTTVYPPAASGGSGLGGNMAAGATVGGTDSPVTGFVDYLNGSGQVVANLADAAYVRQWSIAADATGALKTITVVVRATRSLGRGAPPSTTLVSYKTRME